MSLDLKQIIIDNFKSYSKETIIDTSDLSVFMGANSSGKSTALQALLAIKQTVECNSPGVDLLLLGKYVMLGDFGEVLNDKNRDGISLGISVQSNEPHDEYEEGMKKIIWQFQKRSDSNQHVELSKVLIYMDDDVISYERQEEDLFDIIINKMPSQVQVRINNLLLKEYYILYDSVLNNIHFDLINHIVGCLFGEKTVFSLDRDTVCAIDGFINLFGVLYRKTQARRSNASKECVDIARRVVDLLEKFSIQQMPLFNHLISPVPVELAIQMIADSIMQGHKQQDMFSIVEKYERIFDEEKKRNYIYDKRGKLPERLFYDSDKRDGQSKLEQIRFTGSVYGDAINDVIKNIYYVGPLREKPQGLYNLGFETIPKYVGPTGSYFASVLLNNKKEKEYIFPDGEVRTACLTESLDEWAMRLNIANSIDVVQNNAFGFSVAISNTQNVDSDIMNVGIGTSQVLPVLITGLLSEKGEVLIFEQPELHLHPYSQSRLADFFVELCRHGRKIVVESHSEYLILRLRYHLVANNIDASKLQINFFQNDGGTSVQKGMISGFGEIEYPNDFKDETQELLKELFRAVSKRKPLNE